MNVQFELTARQSTAMRYLLDNTTVEVLFGGGAGGGKSVLGCAWSIMMCLKYAGVRGLIGRSQLKTLRETTLNTFFEVADMMKINSLFTYIAPTTIRFHNGSEILLKDLFNYPSDPNFDELGSLELTFAFIDEANQVVHRAKEIVKSRIRFRLDEYNLTPKILYTCNPAKNWVKTEFHDPYKKGELIPTRAFVQSLLSDNEYIYSGYAESLMSLDEVSRQRLAFGNWDYNQDDNALINAESITNIFTNRHVKPEGNKYITADIARLGSDKTVIRVWHGWCVIERHVIVKQPLTTTAEKIRQLATSHAIPMSRVVCDEDGVGGGVVDILRCKGFVANRSPIPQPNKTLHNYATLKDQCAYHVAKMINENKVFENADGEVREMLIQELQQFREKNIDTDGKRRLIPKDEIKRIINRSPDDGDTYIMRAWFDLSKVNGMTIFV